MFYIPSPEARGYKTHNSFHKYRMKWKFISDPIYITTQSVASPRTQHCQWCPPPFHFRLSQSSLDAWISSWQYFRGFCRKSLPADSRHSNGYELCPSSRRHLSVFIRSGCHRVFALNGKEKQLASRFNLTYRYIDDVLSINNPIFEIYLGQMYPAELEIKDTTESTTSASYLDLLMSIGRDGQLHTSI